MRLSWWLICAQWRARRIASALSLLAIALGVALGCAIHLINDAALADFARAMRTVQGEPDLVLAARDSSASVPLAVVEQVARDPAVLVVAAVIEARVRVNNSPAVRLVGLDVFSAPAIMPKLLPQDAGQASSMLDGGVYASPALLGKFALRVGERVTLTRGDRSWQTTIVGDLPATAAGDIVLVADIAWVQEHFGPSQAVTEARILLAPGNNPASWRAAFGERLPPGLVLRATSDDGRRVANVSRAYRVNLNVLALVALLTGGFLVFATQLTAIAQRSTDFALLGILGLSPRMRLLQVLLEALSVGVPGSLLGIALGYGFALAFTAVLGGDLGGGYFAGSSPQIEFRPLASLAFLLLGCLASLAGAAYPALLNRRQALADALRSGFAPRLAEPRHRWLPVLLLPVAAALTQLPPFFELPLAGYAAIALLLAIGVRLAPLLTRSVFGRLGELPWPAAQRVALQNVAQAPLMAQVAASGLIVSLALTVSMVIMVSSFRSAVSEWLEHVLPAPLYVRSKATPLPQQLLDDLPHAPLARVERTMHASLTLDAQRPSVALLVREIDRQAPARRLPFTGEVRQPSSALPVVWISEAVQDLYRWQVGETIRLPLSVGETEVFVGGVWRDYARQFGAIVISLADYQRLGGDFQASDLALWPQPGEDRNAVAWLARYGTQYGFEVTAGDDLRQLSLSIFDQSFAITHALEAAAMLIGLFGLTVTLAASVWLRRRELATLGALGFQRGMLAGAVMLEGALIALIGLLLGLACGLAIGAILTFVVNPQAFHWRMSLSVPWPLLLAGALVTLAAAVVASGYAARQAVRLPFAQILARSQ